MKKTLRTLTLLALLSLLLAACMSQPQRISLTAQDIHWDVEELHVQANRPVELTIYNQGALDHALQIRDLDVDLLLSPGDVEVITFTIDQATTIEFICSIPGHDEAGMVGNIIVSP